MSVTVTITTHDGKVYTDPSKIHIPRNSDTEPFYRLLENYIPALRIDANDKTAE